MTFSEAITEVEETIERFEFLDRDGCPIPSPIVTALVAKHNQERWERVACRLARQEITPAEYLKEMLEMLEVWMRKRFMNQVLTKFARLENA